MSYSISRGKKVTISLACTIFLFLVNCGPQFKVTTDYDKHVNFQEYKTYKLVQLQQQHQTISELNVERIIRSIKSEMEKKGFTESETPDLEIVAVTILKGKQQVTATTDYYGYGGMYRPYGWDAGMGTGVTTYNVYNYTDGSLIIDIADSKTKKLIWEGVGNSEIDGPIKDPDKKIPLAIAKIMEDFPPGSAKKKK